MTELPPQAPSDEPRIALSRSVIFPLVGGRSTWRQEHLLPIFLTLLVGIALFAVPFPWPQLTLTNGKPAVPEINEAWQIFFILAIYIAFLVNYYINQMCGRPKPGWLLTITALFTFVLLPTKISDVWSDLFYGLIPTPAWQKSTNLFENFAGSLLGTGLFEESLKAFPLIALALVGVLLGVLCVRSKGRMRLHLAHIRDRIGLCEPLDGIVLGVASGSGFFIQETLAQYLPAVMNQEKYPAAQAFSGLVLLLARGLPELAEHSAWAGLFGYFIGLSMLRPSMAVPLLALGWLSAAALHAAWDTFGTVLAPGFILAALLIGDGLFSYALLGGAIFKARDLSPRLAAAIETGPIESDPADWD